MGPLPDDAEYVAAYAETVRRLLEAMDARPAAWARFWDKLRARGDDPKLVQIYRKFDGWESAAAAARQANPPAIFIFTDDPAYEAEVFDVESRYEWAKRELREANPEIMGQLEELDRNWMMRLRIWPEKAVSPSELARHEEKRRRLIELLKIPPVRVPHGWRGARPATAIKSVSDLLVYLETYLGRLREFGEGVGGYVARDARYAWHNAGVLLRLWEKEGYAEPPLDTSTSPPELVERELSRMVRWLRGQAELDNTTASPVDITKQGPGEADPIPAAGTRGHAGEKLTPPFQGTTPATDRLDSMLRDAQQGDEPLQEARAVAARKQQQWQALSDAWDRVYLARPEGWSLGPERRFPAADWVPCAAAMIVVCNAIKDAGYEQRIRQVADRAWLADGSNKEETFALVLLVQGFELDAPALAEKLSNARPPISRWLNLFNRDAPRNRWFEEPPAEPAASGPVETTPPAAVAAPVPDVPASNGQHSIEVSGRPAAPANLTEQQPCEADRKAKLATLQPAERKAYFSFLAAEAKAGERLEDREAYDRLKEHGLAENGGDLGELTDYVLPVFDTWSRQLRTARKALGEQKYTRRAGRQTGSSIVKASELEPPS